MTECQYMYVWMIRDENRVEYYNADLLRMMTMIWYLYLFQKAKKNWCLVTTYDLLDLLLTKWEIKKFLCFCYAT